jgi:pyrophosphatase PpaX
MQKKKLIIFDFDDTIGHLTVRWSDVKKELVEWAGRNGGRIDPAEHIIVLSNRLSETAEGKKKVVEVFNKYESECVRKRTYLMFPSMVELAKALKKAGYALAIATGNNTGTVSAVLEAEGLSGIFEFISGMDNVKLSKPDPETLDAVIKRLGIEKKDALFIGNSDFDVMAGRNAGIDTIKIRTLWEDDVSMLRKLLLG